ncbi:MAG TPA: hypothetical protein VGS27_27670 [Candidatus Sulfotelmatobacter sp.]|nr:hypothetical protein [Candidatus Sulfotelmatobacter sp.]
MTERPIDQIKRAEEGMRELLKAASELRRQVSFACAEYPEETAELVCAAESLEREVEVIKARLQQWRQGIQ